MSFFSNIRYAYKRWRYAYNRFYSHVEGAIIAISTALDIATGVASVACLISLTVLVGYDLSAADRHTVWVIIHCCQALFLTGVLYNLLLRFRHTIRNNRIIKWIADLALLVTLLAWIYPNPEHPWIPWLKQLLYSRRFLLCVLGAYSIIDICYAVSRIPNRRTNPSLLMGGSFLLFILVGSFMLMLPRCTYDGISYFDSLFVSASAVCITGLSSVDIASTFTPFGILVLSVLIQLGSLGIITFTSFFAMFFTGNTSIYNQLLLRDMIYSKSMNSLVPTLLYVLGFTIVVELAGAVAVYLTIPASLGMGVEDKLMFAAFHSMSSFCNVGFSCLPGGMANEALLHSNQLIYIVTSVLIFAGAIGFPILVNFKEIIKYYLRKLWLRIRGLKAELMPVHVFDLNTKIVLYTTLAVLVVGSVAFFILESGNSMRGMDAYTRVVQSVFNSLIPRSAGFASVNPATFLNVTLLLIVVQMIIGGSSQSMAGGIKVNTLGVILLNLRAVLLGHKGSEAFNRKVNPASVQRAQAIVAISVIALVAYSVTVLILEPQLSFKATMFEVVSALFTVGSSLGITDQLGDATKVVLCTAMFFGRVGILSFLCGIMGRHRDLSDHLPTENVIIN